MSPGLSRPPEFLPVRTSCPLISYQDFPPSYVGFPLLSCPRDRLHTSWSRVLSDYKSTRHGVKGTTFVLIIMGGESRIFVTPRVSPLLKSRPFLCKASEKGLGSDRVVSLHETNLLTPRCLPLLSVTSSRRLRPTHRSSDTALSDPERTDFGPSS